MSEPKLRTVNKAVPPYPMNKFPKEFVERFAANIVYMLATKETPSLEGNEWEQIFADCIGAQWKPSNIGLDDVVLKDCCWSAKTVKSSSNIETQSKVRLISGRNSPIYSYGVDKITEVNPNEIGEMVLGIWNERVSSIRQYYKFARTVVLVKGENYSDYLVFETDTIRYDPELYYFVWNKRGNLEGYSKADDSHAFTWQPHGSQFTIIEDIPKNRYHLRVQKPQRINKEDVLRSVGFDKSWVTKVETAE